MQIIKRKILKKIKVICKNNGKIFESLSSAAKWCNLNDRGQSIKYCIEGKQRTAGFNPEKENERLLWELYCEGGDAKLEAGEK